MTDAGEAYLAHLGIELSEDELAHFGKKGMKWGVRKERPATLEIRDTDTAVTKKAKEDYNKLDDSQFMAKYATTKGTYAKRVEKHGDPYAAKNSQKNRDILEARDRQAERANDLQRQAFKTYSADGERAMKMAQNKYDKMELDLLSNPDAQTAARMTSGEKIATGIMTGVYGSLLIASVALAVKK